MSAGLSRFRLNSLRSRLMLLVALAITPIAVMTVMNGIREREQAIKASEENVQRLTGLAAANVAWSTWPACPTCSVLRRSATPCWPTCWTGTKAMSTSASSS
jgi:hypothetical protein